MVTNPEKGAKGEVQAFAPFITETLKRVQSGLFTLFGEHDSKRARAEARVIGISLSGDSYLPREVSSGFSSAKTKRCYSPNGGTVQPLLSVGMQ